MIYRRYVLGASSRQAVVPGRASNVVYLFGVAGKSCSAYFNTGFLARLARAYTFSC